MADGQYRFHPSGAGPFYHPQHSQHNNHRTLNRAASPHGSRRPFSNDTPSPSRSPVNAASSHNFTMYNHNGYQGQHGLMNGGPRYTGMQLPKYQQNHHQHHNQVNQHHNQHHPGSNLGHHHNISSGGYSSATPHLGHYSQDHGQNGSADGLHQDDMDDIDSEYWMEQIKLAGDSQASGAPHHRAKQAAHEAKGINFVPMNPAGDQDTLNHDRSLVAGGQKISRQSWDELDFGGQGLRALATPLFGYDFLRRLILTHNQLDRLPPAIGKLKNLQHLDLSHNQLQELPEEIGMLINLRSLWLFSNMIQSLPDQLGYLYRLETLGIEGNPLNEEMKEKMMEEGTKGLVRHLREHMAAPPAPLDRPWEVVEEGFKPSSDPEKFTALTFNILCERYATASLYGYVPEGVLRWDYRKELILSEVVERDADIVCFQELDRNSYDDFFRGRLAEQGYKSSYAQKSRAETLGESAKFVDGCGTFWKDKKYVLLDSQHLVLGRKAVERPGAKASADMLNRVWQRDDIATVTLLENRATGSRVVVVNSHFYWDPAFKDVKLIQAAVLMEELSKITDRYSKIAPCTNKAMFRFSNADNTGEEPVAELGPSLEYSSGNQIPMIFCGDFNSGLSSAVYNLLAHGGIDSNHSDFDDRNYGSFSDSGMRHPFSLKSAYGSIGELPFTNYTPDFVDVLDYIWYSSNTLRVTAVLGKLDEDYLQRVPGFPNFHYPSDHLALMAEFLVEKPKSTQRKTVDVDFGPSSRK